MTNVADLAIESLRSLGINQLFCLPGVQNDDFFDRLVDARDITPIVARHEQGAAYMAFGASQITGQPAACCVVPGPGLLNAGAALTSAYWAGGRVLALVGAIADHLKGGGFGALHELPDATKVLEQVTKHAAYVASGDDAVATIQTALDTLMTNEARPVSIEVPVNVWSQAADGLLQTPVRSLPTPDSGQISRAAALLAGAKNPLIVVGGGAYDASPEVQELAEMLQAPTFTRRQGHGVLDARHPLWVPLTVGRDFWAETDAVVGIGTRMEFPLGWGTKDLNVIQINIDAEELDRHGIGTIGIHADAAHGARELIDALAPINPSRQDRSEDLAARRAAFDQDIAHLEPQLSTLAAIRDVLPDDGVIVEDVTQMGFAAHLAFEFRHPRTFLTSGAAGTLGAGVAHAIGAQAAAPDRVVLNLVGDGGFLFSATELATAVQYNIPVTILLHENGAYGNVKRIQSERFGPDRTIASTLQNPDFVAFGESFGVQSQGVSSVDDLRPALESAFAHDGPSLVVAQMDAITPNPWPFLRMPAVR